VANLLLSLGAGPRTKVLWCGPNSPEVVAVMNATRKIGAIAVPLNYRLTHQEALYVINHSDAEVVYTDHEHAPMFTALRDQLEKVRHIIAVGAPAPDEILDGMLGDADIAAASDEAPDAADPGGSMICTSGTTGKPKGAFRGTPANPEVVGALLSKFGFRPDDNDVAVFGIPSEQWGEVVHATVVRTPGSSLTGDEITAFARQHLASYKAPALAGLRGRTAPHRLRQDPQAPTPRPLLGRPHRPGRLRTKTLHNQKNPTFIVNGPLLRQSARWFPTSPRCHAGAGAAALGAHRRASEGIGGGTVAVSEITARNAPSYRGVQR
jgi:acyl-CoA synthetase (AMP-forming)/AMP-acid ligase II